MKSISEIIASLSKRRQAKIEARREALINEYLAATADEVITIHHDGSTTRVSRANPAHPAMARVMDAKRKSRRIPEDTAAKSQGGR